MYHLSCKSNVGHGIEYHGIWDVIAYPHDLAIEAGLHPIYVFPFPESHRGHRCTDIYQHRPRKAAGQLLDDVRFCLAYPPSKYLDVLVDLLPGHLQLLLPVARDSHPQVLDRLGAFDATDLLDVLLREYLRLLLVEAEVPLLLQRRQLLYHHCQLVLVVSHDQHVVSERQ